MFDCCPTQDPSETTDISGDKRNRKIFRRMKKKLSKYRKQMLPTVEPEKVPGGKPQKHGGAWVTGWC